MKRTLPSLLALLLAFALLTASPVHAQNPGGIATAPIQWNKADAITGATDNTALTSWAASAGQTMAQATVAKQPTYHAAGGANGTRYVTFTGSQGLYTTALTSAAGSYTVFMVVQTPDSTNAHWGLDTQSGRMVLFPFDTGSLGAAGFGVYDGAAHSFAASPPSGSWEILEWDLDSSGGTSKGYINGAAQTTSTYSSKAFGGTTSIGNAEDVANGAASVGAPVGNLSEVIVFNSLLSASDKAAVGTALTAKYALTTTYPSSSAVIAANSAGLLYSPYNWLVTAGAAKTINAGAYLRTQINASTTCAVGLTIGAATPYSQCLARIDGGAWQKYTPTASGAQSWSLTMPTGTTAANHFLELMVKSTTETQDRWTTQTTAVQVTGLTLDPGATVSLPASRKYRLLVYGDSITEGVRANGFTGIASDTDRNDASLVYSYRLGELLNAEVGVVGFGATGVVTAGSGNVPVLPTSYNALWSGQSRSFTPVPDLVIYNEGTNEGGASFAAMQTGLSAVINGVGYSSATYSGLSGTRHLILRPFNGAQSANLSSIAAAFASPNIVFGDTTGFWATGDSSDNLHPYAYAQIGQIAPQVAGLAIPLLKNAASYIGRGRRLN